MIDSIFPLRECELFRDLADEELSSIAILCSEVVEAEGVELIREGQNADRLFVVTRGKVALHKRLGRRADRRATTVAFCSSGQILGWSALVPPGRYTLSATAWEPVMLLAIPAPLLRRAIDLNPDMGLRIMRCLSEIMARRLQQVTVALTTARETPFRERPLAANPLTFEFTS